LVLQNPGLAAGSKAPANGHGERGGAIRDGVGALVAHGFNCVGICTLAERHLRVRFESGIGSGEFDCPAHWC
jgi:hypothetical protein